MTPAFAHREKPSFGFILLLGALTAFAPLSIDMYLPAFPAMAQGLGVPIEAVQRTMAVFFLGMAAGQLAYGPISDRFGRKRPLLAGLMVYVVASIGCAGADSAQALTWWRLLEALGGCAGIVISRALVRDNFDTVHSARLFSQLMLVMGVAPILAPLLGGQVLLYEGWRAIFWVLAAFGAVCFGVVMARLPDVPNSIPVTGGIREVGRTLASILRDRHFSVPALTTAAAQAGMFAYIIGSPGVFIEHFGVSPGHYGFFFGTNAMAFIGASQVNAHLLKRVSPYRILRVAASAVPAAGGLIAVVGWTEIGGLWTLAGALFLFLFCLGFIAPNGAACALAFQGKRAGSASALLGTLQFAAAAIAGVGVSAVGQLPGIGGPLRSMSMLVALCAVAAFAVYQLGRGHVPPSAPAH